MDSSLDDSAAGERESSSLTSLRGILNAMPAHVAVLDASGAILMVNEAWQQFAAANLLKGDNFLVGHDYLAVCEQATGAGSENAGDVAAGIRSVLKRTLPEFSMEYPCHSPSDERWFRLVVTPLQHGELSGAVALHFNTTRQHTAELALERAERLSRESESRLKYALAAARIGDWDMDLRTNVARRSLRHDQCFGYSEAVATWGSDAFLDHVYAGDRDRVDACYRAAKGGEGDYDVEFRCVWPDGTTHWLWSKGRFYFDESGAPYRVAGIVTDITLRKAAEADLASTVQRLTEAQRIGRIGDWEWDHSSGVVTWSPEVFDVLGRDPQHGPPQTLESQFALYDEPSRDILRAKVERAMSSGQAQEYELVAIRPDGTRVHVLARAVPRINPAGQVSGLYGTIQDISDRKRADLQVFRLASIVESSADAIMSISFDGNLTSWNEGAARLFGYSADEMIGNSVMRLVPSSRLEEAAGIIEKVRLGGIVVNHETSRLRRDGVPVDVSVTVSPIRDRAGEVAGVAAVLRDLSDRKRLEQQFLRAQRMESIGTLAGGIAHDLNNVLSPIMLSLELLRANYPDTLDRDVLDAIERSAQHGADLVRQILSFARGVEGDRVEVRMHQVIRDVERTARDTFLKHVSVRASAPSDLWSVLGDATQLQQVLVNLCVNARDAMPSGGTLSISAENVTLLTDDPALQLDSSSGPYVLVRVEDTGSGMSPDTIERIFDPFFTTKEFGKGTGLGLSTVLTIVKSHGGFLRVYSEPGKGTTFIVYLPAQVLSSEVQQRRILELPRGQGELVLVVDDEPSMRQITQQTLEAYGYRAVVASDGAEAVAIYASRGAEIAVVFTDMMMPIMDGPSAIRALRKLNPKVRIIAASGLELASQSATDGLELPYFLAKPYAAYDLLSTLRACLDVEE